MDNKSQEQSSYVYLPEKQGYIGEISNEAKKIIQLSLDFHNEFDKRWKEEKRHFASYHNKNHIQATINAATLLINIAFNKGIDPLGLIEDLQKWNKQHPHLPIRQNEFLELVTLAFAMHDLGNIADGVTFDEKGNLILNYLDVYNANGAEKRSIQIAESLIKNSRLNEDKKARYLPLIRHLIQQTTFQPTEEDKNQPFAIFVRVVDQIGGNLFNSQSKEEIVFGLIEEMVNEKGVIKINPYYFFNFVNLRFPQLVEDESKRKKVFEVFGKEEPKNDERLLNSEVEIKKEGLVIH